MIELYQLEELAAFSDCGTISGVGERLGVSQPAVSRAMRLLEEAFGVPLFNRSSNSVSLNSTGEKAARHARLIVEAVQRAVEDVRAYDRSLNTVLVGSEAPAPLWSVAPLLSPFFPGKVIAGELTDARTLQEGLGSGRFRMVITTCPLRLAGHVSVRLGHEDLMFVLSADHALAGRRSLSFADMDGQNMLLFNRLGFWRSLTERMMPHSRFYVQSDMAAMRDFVAHSSIPSFTTNLAGPVAVKGKVVIPVSDKEAHVEYFVTGRSGDLGVLSQLARSFAPFYSSLIGEPDMPG